MKRPTMTWRSTIWARWLGWTALYALALWSGVVSSPLVAGWGIASLLAWSLILGLLILALLIGARYRSWWWVLSPLVVILLPAYLISVIGQTYLGWPSDTGWLYVFILSAIYTWVTTVAAAVGVGFGKERQRGRAGYEAWNRPPETAPRMAVQRGISPPTMAPIRQRPILLVVVLTLLSLGLYLFVWFEQTWSELKRVIGDSGMRPVWHALGLLVPIFNLSLILAHFRTINQQSVRRRLPSAIAPAGAVAGIAAGGLASFAADLIPNTPHTLRLALALTGALLLAAIIVPGQRALNRIYGHDFGPASQEMPAAGEWVALVTLAMAFGLILYTSPLAGDVVP